MTSQIRKLLTVLENADYEHSEELAKTGKWGKAGAGAVVVAKSTGRILLPQRSMDVLEPYTWGVWGGAIDPGMSALETVEKELEEEAAYSGNLEIYPLYTHHGETGFVYYTFLALVPDEFTPTLNWESMDAEWFDFGNWPKPLHPGVTELLNNSEASSKLEKVTAIMKRNGR